MMVHAFMLVVVLGTGEERKVQPNPMYFRSIDVCQYYASRIPRQYGNFKYKSFVDPKDRVCLLYTSPSPRDAHESRMPSSA